MCGESLVTNLFPISKAYFQGRDYLQELIYNIILSEEKVKELILVLIVD